MAEIKDSRRRLAERIAKLLNDVIDETDPEELGIFLAHRVSCSRALADHPTVQVLTEEDGTLSVGILGLLNGLVGVDAEGRGIVAVEIDEDDGRSARAIVLDRELAAQAGDEPEFRKTPIVIKYPSKEAA